jgi:hypothetical protein
MRPVPEVEVFGGERNPQLLRQELADFGLDVVSVFCA